MSEWSDFDEAAVAAQHSLHSGVTVDCFRGNLLRAAEQSYFDVTSYNCDGDDYVEQGLTTSFTMLTDFNAILVPVRRKPASQEWRDLEFSAWAYTSAGTATVRVYALPFSCACTVDVDATDGIIGSTAYASLNIANTSYEYKTWNAINFDDVHHHRCDDVGIEVPLIWLMIVAKVDSGTANFRIAMPRVREVTT